MKTYHHLSEINQYLEKGIDLCNKDFLSIGEVIKSYFHEAPEYLTNKQHVTSDIIKKLQFADSFTQRIKHIIYINDLIYSFELAKDEYNLKSLTILNYIQSVAINYDYNKTTSEIKHLFDCIQKSMVVDVQPECNVMINFTHENSLSEIIRRVIEIYLNVINKDSFNASQPLISNSDYHYLNKIYTTSNEQFISLWLNNNIYININHVLKHYIHNFSNNKIEDIELF